MDSWRAGCGETRTSGSEGGPGKRTVGNDGTAPRARPYSRLITHGAFYPAEDLQSLLDCLKKAILKRGVPARLYCDNGVIYTSRQFSRIVAELGIHHISASPYAPEGKGKIERFWLTVDFSFLPELKARPAETLEELNALFAAWLEQGYHHWENRETGETPAARFARALGDIRLPDPARLAQVFLWKKSLKADKTAQVSLEGNRYEVDPRLARRKVELRYDPFDLSTVQVWYDGRRFDDARPYDLVRQHDRPVRPPVQERAVLRAILGGCAVVGILAAISNWAPYTVVDIGHAVDTGLGDWGSVPTELSALDVYDAAGRSNPCPLSGEEPYLVLLVDPGCGMCRDVAAWVEGNLDRLPIQPTLIVVATDTVKGEAPRALPAGRNLMPLKAAREILEAWHLRSQIYFDLDSTLAPHLSLQESPSLLLVLDGRIVAVFKVVKARPVRHPDIVDTMMYLLGIDASDGDSQILRPAPGTPTRREVEAP